jgi:serine phosphatase RsbU (regulator of sigma subunit)
LTVRLAVVVVLTVLAVVGAGAAVDYHREYRVHFERVFASLEEQAKTLQVTRGRIHGDQAFARYVNDLCAQMNEFVSPGHHILIMDAEGNVIASTRHHSGAEVERALLEAPPSARVLTVGDHRLAQIRVRDEDGATIVLAQYLDRVERILRGQLVRSALIAAVTSAALIGLIFLAIHVWVLKPFGGLHEASRAWAARDFTARAPKSGTTDLRALADQFNRMAAQLETHQRQQRAELQRARAIQHALLPQRLPDVAGVTFAAAYHPAEYVAGDLYDVWSLPDGRTAVVILDVSGHGIAAALLTGAVKISLHRRLEICEGPGDALRLVNGDLLAWVPEDRFVTACAGVWDTRSQTWTYASAAHPGGLLVSDGQVKALTSTGPPLGIQAEVTWDEQRVALGPGDRLLLYTDGVTDAGHPGKTLGEDGLRRIVHHTSGEDVDRQVEAVTREVLARSRTGLADDATLLAFRVQRAT